MTRLSAWKMACTVVVLSAASAIVSPAQVFTSLVSFDGQDGDQPYWMSLVQGGDGNFYGTTLLGGAHALGSAFSITPLGNLTTLYSFCRHAHCSDGGEPLTGLVLAADENFYGTTTAGGDNNSGTIFKISLTGRVNALPIFHGANGYTPAARLIQCLDGNFYGTTYSGGANNSGTVFKITSGGALTTLHSFDQSDGASPLAGLVQGTDGNFYGTTVFGGKSNSNCGNGCGTIFRIRPTGKLTTAYNFCAKPGCTDGNVPYAGLVQGSDGDFYGTTAGGGTNNSGTVFRITSLGQLTTLYSFCVQAACSDGNSPQAALVQGSDGNFYGTTVMGGNSSCPTVCGTIFRITPAGELTTLHSFDGSDGFSPTGGLLQATSGLFYGTTRYGGDEVSCDSGCGTVFSLDMGLAPFVTFVRAAGRVGQTGSILGQAFTGTTGVSFNGTPANFSVVSDTLISATVPVGATTGYVTVTTPSGTLTSNVPFHVIR